MEAIKQMCRRCFWSFVILLLAPTPAHLVDGRESCKVVCVCEIYLRCVFSAADRGREEKCGEGTLWVCYQLQTVYRAVLPL